MSPSISLIEYACLYRQFQFYARRGCVPPIEVRSRFKWLESHLPSNLVSYVNILTKHPRLCCGQPLGTISWNGCCGNCGELVPAENLVRETAFVVCENCNAVLISDGEICDAEESDVHQLPAFDY